MVTTALFAGTILKSQAQGQQVGLGHWEIYKTDYNGEQRIHVDGQNPDSVLQWSERAGLGHTSGYDTRTQPAGVGGFTMSEGSLRIWFRWVRRTIKQLRYYPGYGNYYQWVPDPRDNPPSSLVFAATVDAQARANSDYTDQQTGPGLHRMPATEYVAIDVLGRSDNGHDDGQLTKADLQFEKLYTVATGSAMQTSPEGYEIVPGPWLDLSVTAGLNGGRSYKSGSVSVAIQGVAYRHLTLSPEPQHFYARTQSLRPGAGALPRPAAASRAQPVCDDG